MENKSTHNSEKKSLSVLYYHIYYCIIIPFYYDVCQDRTTVLSSFSYNKAYALYKVKIVACKVTKAGK